MMTKSEKAPKSAAQQHGKAPVRKAMPKTRAAKTTKKARLILLLSNKDGATVETLAKKLDWLPHTTRAALTRLKQQGLALERVPAGNGDAAHYRIVGEPDTAAAK